MLVQNEQELTTFFRLFQRLIKLTDLYCIYSTLLYQTNV